MVHGEVFFAIECDSCITSKFREARVPKFVFKRTSSVLEFPLWTFFSRRAAQLIYKARGTPSPALLLEKPVLVAPLVAPTNGKPVLFSSERTQVIADGEHIQDFH